MTTLTPYKKILKGEILHERGQDFLDNSTPWIRWILISVISGILADIGINRKSYQYYKIFYYFADFLIFKVPLR